MLILEYNDDARNQVDLTSHNSKWFKDHENLKQIICLKIKCQTLNDFALLGKTLYKKNRQERKLFSIAKTSVIGFRQIHSGDYDETLTQVTLLYSIKDIW